MRQDLTPTHNGELYTIHMSTEEVRRRQRLDGLLELAEIVRKRHLTDNQYRHRLQLLLALVGRPDLRGSLPAATDEPSSKDT